MSLFRHLKHVAATASLATIGATSAATATIIPPATLKVLAQRSDAVIHGTIVRQETRVNVDGLPWTFYTLQVLNVMAGEIEGSEFTFRCAGGMADTYFTVVDGTPVFAVGDEMVFFYLQDEPFCQVSGFTQGVFRRMNSAAGVPGIVNGDGFELTAFSSDDVVLGRQLERRLPNGLFTPGEEPQSSREGPAADAEGILDELSRFARAFAHRAHRVSSTKDLPTPTSVRGKEPAQPKDASQ